MKRFAIAMAVLVSATMTMAKDIKTMTLTPNPQMKCENCATKIKNKLRYETGVKDIKTDVSAQTVTVSYDADKTSEKTLIEAFNKTGRTFTKTNGKTVKKQNCTTDSECSKKGHGEGCSKGDGNCCKEGKNQGQCDKKSSKKDCKSKKNGQKKTKRTRTDANTGATQMNK